jgi:hypothetical protein
MAAFGGYQPISQPLHQYSVGHAAGLAHGLQLTAAAAIFSAARRLAKRRPLARRLTLERIVESRILIDRTWLSRCARRTQGIPSATRRRCRHRDDQGRRPEHRPCRVIDWAIQAFGGLALLAIFGLS